MPLALSRLVEEYRSMIPTAGIFPCEISSLAVKCAYQVRVVSYCLIVSYTCAKCIPDSDQDLIKN